MKMGSNEAVAFAQRIAQERKAEYKAKQNTARRTVTMKDMVEIRNSCFKQAVAEIYGGRYMENIED